MRRGPLGYNDGSQSVASDWTDQFAGTGAAACYAGGVAALMASHDPLLEPLALKEMMVSTATDLPFVTQHRDDLRLVGPLEAVKAAIKSARERERGGS